MSYTVKEIYYTLQGEGRQTGRPAVFLRFSGCNLWTGREEDRDSAVCSFCDTDFVGTDGPGGGKFETPEQLADAVAKVWSPSVADSKANGWNKRNGGNGAPFVVCTGGEPLLQLDDRLVAALQRKGFAVAVETNGTLPPPAGVDWLCVSPKAGADLVVRKGDELKLVYPQAGLEPAEFESLDFDHFSLQPMDGAELQANVRLAIAYCLGNPKWALSLQMHKFAGIP